MARTLTFFAGLFAFFCAHAALARQFPTEAVKAAIRAEMARDDAYGASVAIARRGKIVMLAGFGRSSVGGSPVTARSEFEIGSDTKQFTAAAILQLKEAGRLSLDDPLANYVPSFPHAREVTVRQLLDQTSGLFDFIQTNHFLHLSQSEPASLETIEKMASGPLRFEPGSRCEYSNTNYIALGRVIELVSGETYETYMRRHVFARAGLRRTGFVRDEEHLPGMATGYWRGPKRNAHVTVAPGLPYGWLGAAGGIVSTAADMVRWDEALKSGTVVSPQDFALMTAPQRLAGGGKDDYGFGWWIDPVHGHTDIYHDGDTLEMSSSNNLFPDYDLDIVVLENAGNDSASRTARAVFAALLPWLDGQRH